MNESLPLSGLCILDFTRLLPGPWCTQLLADAGATVIKIEHPDEGDPSRHNPPFVQDQSLYFHGLNRNKHSLTLNLQSDQARSIAYDLFAKADIVIENFRGGVTEKLKIDYLTAKQHNERLIYCSITGFGKQNPNEKMGAHDINVQGLTGCLNRNGTLHHPSFLAADFSSATYASIAILLALLQRAKTQQGCYLDISMFDSLFTMQNLSLASQLASLSNSTPQPNIEVWGGNPRYALYRTKDDQAVSVSLLEKKFWKIFCEEIQRLDLYDPEESAQDMHTSFGPRGKLYRDAIEQYCKAHNRDAITQRMLQLGMHIFPVYSPEEAVRSPFVQYRNLIESPNGIPTIANPLWKSLLSPKNASPPPSLGSHSETLLAQLGYSAEKIHSLKAAKVI
jgi:CoA:oxalate CoA-transferase